MPHFAKYKNILLNIENVNHLSVRKISKNAVADLGYFDIKVSKDKLYVLRADHMDIDCFKSRDDAMKTAVDIVSGKYDVKI